MRIIGIDVHVLLEPSYDVSATSSAQDNLVVEIHTDEGVSGIGECDVNPWMARACILAPGTHTMGQGLSDMLIGEDPRNIERIWNKLYVGSAMNGRRGVVLHAMGAIDMALHDLKGKLLGVPVYELLGGAVRSFITPYASLQPEVSDFNAYRHSLAGWAAKAKQLGFRAAKAECTLFGPYSHKGLSGTPEQTTEVVAAVRQAVGSDFTLMVDVQYAFPNADACLATIRNWEPYDIYFLETPIWSDDLDGYARLAREQPIPISAGEWLATRYEFEDLMDRGLAGVVQPDPGRVGGLLEAQQVCNMAKARGRKVVPHIWKTGISISAGIHLAAANEHVPFIEFLPKELCESALRKELVIEDFAMADGQIPLPTKPGLGVELNRDALGKFKEAADKAVRDRIL
ncbi:MAG: mandelate racemase/muconate lactonizing enzyme family protein [Paenibacillaceae bacterium]|nr:mandelate racemase/muconate lactonizing enzyme family protein [Paenibacillaceae bacterium]